MKYSDIKKRARKLRNNPTPEEQILWQELRKRKMGGYKLLRQHPIIYESRSGESFFYIPDFYCSKKKLIIELDGKIHDYQINRDKHREEILKNCNLHVLRIKNEELLNMKKIIQKIEKVLKRLP
jgi:leucyl-tRNA synthetase